MLVKIFRVARINSRHNALLENETMHITLMRNVNVSITYSNSFKNVNINVHVNGTVRYGYGENYFKRGHKNNPENTVYSVFSAKFLFQNL